jgi:hypothetical protein
MMRELYANNYDQRRREALLRSGGQCENIIEGRRCPNRVGMLKVSHAHDLYFEQLYVHHVNGDPENPDAELICYCASCHMKVHRKPGSNGKASPQKQGYKVVKLDQLLFRLAGVGFSASFNEECRVTWRFDPCLFEAEAADMLDALEMCLHWLGGEVRNLEEALAQAQAEQRRLTDMVTRLDQAEERRLCDVALRGDAYCMGGGERP